MQNSFKSKIKYFISESVRPRSREEYAEVLRRGLCANDGKTLSPHTAHPCVPWLWLRVLAVLFILFSLAVLVYRLCVGATDLMVGIVLGGLTFNAATLTFFYELYPEKNLNLPLIFAVALAGGALAGVVSSLGYEYIYTDPNMSRPWVSLIWTAFWEEFVKFIVALPAICLLFKNKNPFACFLIGFAVGTGFSFFEDLGYIYAYSRGYNFKWLTLMSVGRGLSCAFSHAPWTGLICWAFAYFKKPLLNFRFYLSVFGVIVLHYFADIPFFVDELAFLTGLNWGWLIEAAVVAAIVTAQFFALKLSCKKSDSCLPDPPVRQPLTGVAARRKKLSHAANVTALCGAVFASALILVGCTLDIGYKISYRYFDDDQSFISYIQNGLNLSADWKREYGGENYSEHYENGKLTRAVQRETKDGYDYFYYYQLSGDDTALRYIGVAVEDTVYYCRRLTVYENDVIMDYGYPNFDDGIYLPPDGGQDEDGTEEPPATPPSQSPSEREPTKEVSYFALVNERPVYDAASGRISLPAGEILAGGEYAITLGVLFAVAVTGSGAAAIILKIKSGRYSDD